MNTELERLLEEQHHRKYGVRANNVADVAVKLREIADDIAHEVIISAYRKTTSDVNEACADACIMLVNIVRASGGSLTNEVEKRRLAIDAKLASIEKQMGGIGDKPFATTLRLRRAQSINILEAAGCKTVYDVARLSEMDLLCERNCGPVTIDDIRQALAQHGLHLHGDDLR